MTRVACALLFAAIAGCASVAKDERIVARNNAIEDYVQVSELKETPEIRKRGELHHTEISQKYLILRDKRNAYLAAFWRRCHELDDHEVTPDIRHDPRIIQARFDTYRGCRIETLYELNDGQVKELLDLAEKSYD